MSDWWSDEPILHSEDDRFGRRRFIDHAISLVRQIGTRPSSAVIGLVGPWGSGKTSSMRLIAAGLPTADWRVAWVNPWAVGGPDAVTAEVLGAIQSVLPPGGKAQRALSQVTRHSRHLTPAIALLPYAGEPLKAGVESVLNEANGSGTLAEQLGKAEKALLKLQQPVLVVLDDLDRLQPDQLLTVFRAIRVLGRLPYVHYLVAYDHQTLLDVLCATPIANGRVDRAVAFLEKIVNLPLDQPPFREEHAERLLTEGIAAALDAAGVGITDEVADRLAAERDVLLSLLAEPRALSRLVAQLRIYLPLVGADEVDLVDFLVLTYLRLAHPLLYRDLSMRSGLLTLVVPGKESSLPRYRYDAESLVERFHVPDVHGRRVARILQRLFPILDPDSHPAQDSAWRAKRKYDHRASDPDCVDRYFALAADENDVGRRSRRRAVVPRVPMPVGSEGETGGSPVS
ncbi:hypothetical protein Dvina_12590 [Dactylosporangium vinaceum]|uniref:P-loop NTPase fold protein n=1 Tax=Dactylosporangium vinaceum TaxID=53362 RepID=A0ABV5MFS9_9ACTN|nr:P-loop NTPase fold protein [Dactylosporangium vinaceum]UAB98832.1 hypothetical protein Dvina_12590 [Dactylosporangium vinaceum]